VQQTGTARIAYGAGRSRDERRLPTKRPARRCQPAVLR
jgi:hypothetical protein